VAAQPPSPPSSAYLTQAGLAASFVRVIRDNWPNLPRAELYGLLQQYARGSASLAARDYLRRRTDAGILSSFRPALASAPSPQHFAKTLDWVYADSQTDLAGAEKRMEGAMTRLALNTGRFTTIAAVEKDRRARLWARETRPGCCYFCAMLAGRGAVYTSAHSAGEDNEFHNHCHCVVVPVFGEYEPTAHARQWAAEWAALKDQHGAVSLNLWRQHFEGRLNQDVPQ